MSEAPSPRQGWIPIEAPWQDGALHVDWCYLGDRLFHEAFFEDTVRACLAHPFNLLFRPRSTIAVLGELAESEPGLAPDGFIFHTSRCGSTLVAQMLAALPRTVVISEARPIESVLRAPAPSAEERARRLRWLLSALGQRRRGDEDRYVVKFDCWHTLDLALIRAAFPRVPWVFLYREPLEVLFSHLRRRGAHTVAGLFAPAAFGIDHAAALAMPAEEYCARVLACTAEAVLPHCRAPGALLVNYSALPQALGALIAPHFGLALGADEQDAMAARARDRATMPGTPFAAEAGRVPDATAERAAAAAATWMAPVYRRLEAVRCGNAAAAV